MTFLTFLQAVKAVLERRYINHDLTAESAICSAAQRVTFDTSCAAKHFYVLRAQISAALVDAQGGQAVWGFATKVAAVVMGDPHCLNLKPEAGLLYGGPLAGAVRLFWLDQMIQATQQNLPLPPFPSREELLPLFQPYLLEPK